MSTVFFKKEKVDIQLRLNLTTLRLNLKTFQYHCGFLDNIKSSIAGYFPNWVIVSDSTVPRLFWFPIIPFIVHPNQPEPYHGLSFRVDFILGTHLSNSRSFPIHSSSNAIKHSGLTNYLINNNNDVRLSFKY